MKVKYIIGESLVPYYNLALENELMGHVTYGLTILYLWQNKHTIVVGKNQDVYSECKVGEFLKDDGMIARRKSGGGAVYHDVGNLNFSIISIADDREQLEYQELIKNALDRFSVKSEYNGRNDITVEGFKISGNAAYYENGVICQHGTILIECDIEKMSFYLTPKASKLRRNRVTSVETRVRNLKTINPRITVESMCEAFILSSEAEEFSYKSNVDRVKRLYDFYASNTWVYGENK